MNQSQNKMKQSQMTTVWWQQRYLIYPNKNKRRDFSLIRLNSKKRYWLPKITKELKKKLRGHIMVIKASVQTETRMISIT